MGNGKSFFYLVVKFALINGLMIVGLHRFDLAKHFKVFYSKVPGPTPTSYTIDHTAGSYIFDAQGKLRLFTRYGTGAEALAHDLKLLLAAR